MKKALIKIFIIQAAVFVGAVLIDLFTKIIFQDKTYPFLSGFISINSVELNDGAAWNFLSGQGWLLIMIAVIFLIGAITANIWFLKRTFKKGNTRGIAVYGIGIAFILGGTLGNLIDRMFLGGVRDFIVFDFWTSFPVFNVADSFLTIGVVLLIVFILFLYKDKTDSKNSTEKK